MNARWYGHHFDDGGFHLYAMAGVDVAGLQARNIALVTLVTDLTYVREMAAGTLFVIRSGFSHVGSKSTKLIHPSVQCRQPGALRHHGVGGCGV